MHVNPLIVFRKEFDLSGLLFHPETGQIFGLNPTSAFIWECLESGMSRAAILTALTKLARNIPESAPDELDVFLTRLQERNFLSGDESPCRTYG